MGERQRERERANERTGRKEGRKSNVADCHSEEVTGDAAAVAQEELTAFWGF